MLIVPRESASHWYFPSGVPLHEVPRADGKGSRPTSLRDARKLGLFPSVTNVLGVISKPGLVAWKMEQAILSALTLPRTERSASQIDMTRCGMETPLRKFESGNPLLTDREACEYLRLCPRQLYALRMRGMIPFVKIGGRTVRYRLRDLDAAIEALVVMPSRGGTNSPVPVDDSTAPQTSTPDSTNP